MAVIIAISNVTAKNNIKYIVISENQLSDKQVFDSNYAKETEYLIFRFSNFQYYNETTIRILPQTCFERDRYDALKLFSFNPDMPQLYSFSSNNIKLAINSIPEINKFLNIRLGLRVPDYGEYSLSVELLEGRFVNSPIFLKDLEMDSIIDLHDNNAYSFISDAGDYDNRFEIHFSIEDGKGTGDDPFQIRTASDLNSVRYYFGEHFTDVHFELMNNVDITEYLLEGGEGYSLWGDAGWMPIGKDSYYSFRGRFDGSGYKISGLWINRSENDNNGLFGYVGDDGIIKNLGLEIDFVKGRNFSGGVVGFIDKSTIENCYVLGGYVSGVNHIGGFAGYAKNSNISNNYGRVNVNRIRDSLETALGGFVGSNYQSIITNSYSTGWVYDEESANYFADKGFAGEVIRGGIFLMESNFWDIETSFSESTGGEPEEFAVGLPKRQMKSFGAYSNAGWDFQHEMINGNDYFWGINENDNDGYPFLILQGYETDDLMIWTGSINNYWNDSTNWSPGLVPCQDSRIAIPSGIENYPVIEDESEVKEITVAKNAGLIISPTGMLTVTGYVFNDSYNNGVLIQSSEAGTGSIIHDNENVKATMQRYFPVYGQAWSLISAPVYDMNIIGSDFAPGNGDDFYLWDESGWWRNFKADNFEENNDGTRFFIKAKGYLTSFKNPNDPIKIFTGNLNVGDIYFDLNHGISEYQSGWNLIGNPYPSAIDWSRADKTNIEDDFAYVYNSEQANYIAIENGIISANQGFFVKAVESCGNFLLSNDIRVHRADFSKHNNVYDRLVLSLENENFADNMIIRIVENSDYKRDRRDALKLFSLEDFMPQIYSYTSDERKVVINSIPEIDKNLKILTGMYIPVAGNYYIYIKEITGKFKDKHIFIKDLETGQVHNFNENKGYAFMSEEGEITDRFEIHLNKKTDDLRYNQPHNKKSDIVRYFDRLLHVQSENLKTEISVFNIDGRLISNFYAEPGNHSFSIDLQAGVYIIHAVNQNVKQSLKIVIQ